MAVLFRINAQSPSIEQALADRSIPYLVRGGERFYERPEVRQTLLTLRTKARTMTGVEQGSAVEQMKEILLTLGWTQQPPDGGGALRERWESLAALLSVAEDLETEANASAELAPRPEDGQQTLTLQAVSAELDRRAEAQHVPAAQGVTVSTLHSAKGLEWDAVALLGIHEGSLPFILATSPGADHRGTTAALRRCHPCPATAADFLVQNPKRQWSPPYALAVPRAGAAGFATGGSQPDARTAVQPEISALAALPVLRPITRGGRRTQDRSAS